MPSSWNIDISGQPGLPGGPAGGLGPAGPGYQATSATNFAVGTGPMTFTTQPGLAYTIGARIRVASRADPTQWMEGLCTAYDPVAGSLTLNVDLNNQIVVSAGSSAPILIPSAGKLTYVSASQLKFAPYNGDQIKINGIYYSIPSAGIVGLGNASVFVNGVAGQNLVQSTLYYVYCFNNGGILTADFSTTGHATSTQAGNVGTEIKNGDNTRSLIGLIYTSSGSPGIFVDATATRWVRSWFNSPTIFALTSDMNGLTGNATSGSWVLMGYVANWLNFAGEYVFLTHSGSGYISASNTIYTVMYVDASATGAGSNASVFAANTWCSFPIFLNLANNLAEGRHFAQAAYQCTNSCTLYGSISVQIGRG